MGYKKIVLRIRPKMGKKVDHFREVKRYPPNAGHRQGVGQVSKTSTGRFDSYGLRKRFTNTVNTGDNRRRNTVNVNKKFNNRGVHTLKN